MKGLIRLCYQKRIDAASTKPWERAVFEDTHQEFYMQAQQYDPAGQYPTLADLLTNVPKAEQIHYLTSRVAVGYLRQLDGTIPDIVNAFGKTCLPFTQFKFEIVASHVTQKEAHKIAIYFYSDPLTWFDTVADQLLLAVGDKRADWEAGTEISTELIALPPASSIWSFQPYTPTRPA